MRLTSISADVAAKSDFCALQRNLVVKKAFGIKSTHCLGGMPSHGPSHG
jgi:hypothetical protein